MVFLALTGLACNEARYRRSRGHLVAAIVLMIMTALHWGVSAYWMTRP